MEAKEIVKNGYNAIAAAYLAERAGDSPDLELLAEFIERLPRGATVLDAGCGAGVPVTRYLSRHFQVVGVDFAAAQIELAQRLVPNARFLCQDLTQLDLADESFDGICSYYAIIHIPRQEHPALFRNFYRMLKPAGLALLCLGAGDLPEDVEEDYLGARMYWSHYDADTNLRLLQECGFEVVWSKIVADSTSPGSAHLFVLARKWLPIRPDVAQGVYGKTILDEGVKVVLTRVAPGGAFAPHQDAFGHVFYFLGGEGLATVGDQSFAVQPGLVVRVAAGEVHAYENTGADDLLLISLNVPAAPEKDRPDAEIAYRPIGVIHSPFHDPRDMPIQPTGAVGAEGTAEVWPEFAAGLQDLEGFSHVILLYHFHQAGRPRLTVTPFLDSEPHGVFATRAPTRPNPIGLSIVRLLGVEENVLRLGDVDVLDGTPLLDIKPYVADFDRPWRSRSGWLARARGQVRNVRSDERFQGG